MLQPTACLPPIKHITTYSIADLDDALEYLTSIYRPPVRGTRRRRAASSSIPAPRDDDELNADDLRTDPFERAYAIKWLTALVGTFGEPDADADSDGETREQSESTHRLVNAAAALLAACSGTAGAGTLTRELAFPTSEGPVRVSLTDTALDNDDYGSVGAQTWGGACVLSEMIAENPAAFSLPTGGAGDGPPLRLLELGAGTGLVSLVLAALAARTSNPAHIVTTDYYPSVLANLERNICANFPSSASKITMAPLDWSVFSHTSEKERHPALQEPFHTVFGADIIYEAPHATWIRDCLATLLHRPYPADEVGEHISSGVGDDPAFYLVIPLRSTHAAESRTVEQVFPREITSPTRGAGELELVIKDRQTIVCDTDAQGEEVEYAYYRIGWGRAAQ